MKKRILIWCLIFCLLVCPFGAQAEDVIGILDIQKYGNIILSMSASDFLRRGYTYGDIVTVAVSGQSYDMPVGSNYADVDEGSMICRALVRPETGDDYLILGINMGDMATQLGIAVKTAIDREPGYRWDYQVEQPVEITLSMKEAGGYLDEFILRQLVRSNERSDYAHLTDEAFANFRAVDTTGMGSNRLYRSSSPLDPKLSRSSYADAALAKAGVKTILNLADDAATMRSYAEFDASAYAGCRIIPLNLGIDFAAADFRMGLAEGLRFMVANEGPYLVHCTEGKDRAGFVSALLECLMGASVQEVLDDYMTTYVHYYGVEPGTEKYAVIAERNIQRTLETAFAVEELHKADLAKEAEAYLMEALKLTAEEVEQIRQRLL